MKNKGKTREYRLASLLVLLCFKFNKLVKFC